MFEAEIAATVAYLESAEALRSLDASAYWPKWDSPYWHALLLHEMGETRRIPEITMRHYVDSLNATPIRIFPIHPGEFPDGADPYRDTCCHCQLGNAYQMMAAWGVDVDAELPWIRPWFLKYQMADGGFNCDDTAYLVEDECPSSMVGTIAVFEAVLRHTRRPWTDEEARFLDRGARFLIDRKVMLGSPSRHNAAERTAAPAWLQPCFPRFYHYDILRGLAALTEWSERTGNALPLDAVRPAMQHMERQDPDGAVRIERRSFEGRGTITKSADGTWSPERRAATTFPLLELVSRIGAVSPFLSQQWNSIATTIGG